MEEKLQYALKLIKHIFSAENNSPFVIGITVAVAVIIIAAFVYRKVNREGFQKLIRFVRRFAINKYFMIICMGLACMIVTLHIEVAGAVVFVLLECLLLLFCEDIMVTTLPFLLTCEFLCKMYNSFSTFIKLWPLGLAFIGALVFHFVVYWRKVVFGKLFWGILAVSIATTTGGLFAKGSWSHIDGSGFYYIFGLGFGMLFVYMLLSTHIHTEKDYAIAEKFSYVMMLAGVFAVFIVFQHYVVLLSKIAENPMLLVKDEGIFRAQWKNNISTFLMMSMPFPFYLSFKKSRDNSVSTTFHRYWMGVLIFIALLLAQSRGGILFGTIEFFVCIITIVFIDKKTRRKNLIAMFAMFLLALVFLLSASNLITMYMNRIDLNAGEVRLVLYKDAWENFKRNPIFGIGLCYSGNHAATWTPKTGAINWYQNSILQVLASFGLFGAAAYGFQLFYRIKTLFKFKTKFNITVALSYLGLAMMSLVNPGLFCPVPYLFMLTMMFVIVDKKNEEMLNESDLIEPIRFNSIVNNVKAKLSKSLKQGN